MPTPDGFPARLAALKILDAVLRRGQTMDNAAQASRGLPAADAALALAIAGETFRRLPDLDALIDSAMRQPLPDDAKARNVLRLALAQKIGLDTPDHAVVATALPLVEGGPRRLVHGVLGTLLRRGLVRTDLARLPEPVEARWQQAWGEATVAAARRAIVGRAPLDLSFASDEDAAAFPHGTQLAPRHRRVASSSVAALDGFAAGRWWVQDLASSLPARLIPASATRVLDACAAPGGKTMQLAAAGHDVTALDRSEARLGRLAANLARTGLKATMVVADALDWHPVQGFDAVLLDAPCSATGTFRRHPEVLHRAHSALIAESAERQARLLNCAAEWLRPGGSLVYAVCSLEREEGETRIATFLDGHCDYSLVLAETGIAGIAASPEGWLRILPGQLEKDGGLDGFFVAHLVRAA